MSTCSPKTMRLDLLPHPRCTPAYQLPSTRRLGEPEAAAVFISRQLETAAAASSTTQTTAAPTTSTGGGFSPSKAASRRTSQAGVTEDDPSEDEGADDDVGSYGAAAAVVARNASSSASPARRMTAGRRGASRAGVAHGAGGEWRWVGGRLLCLLLPIATKFN